MSNIHKCKINGTFEIDSPLDIKKDYSMALKRVVIKSIIKKETNEDENFVYTYNLENVDLTTIIDEGRTIKGEPKSASKKLRGAIFYKGEELGVEDSEKFYQDIINKLIINIDDVVDKLLDK
jgi:hypothetical protein